MRGSQTGSSIWYDELPTLLRQEDRTNMSAPTFAATVFKVGDAVPLDFALPADSGHPKTFHVPFLVGGEPVTFATVPQVLVSVTSVWMVGNMDTRPNTAFSISVGTVTTTEFELTVSAQSGQGAVNGMEIQWFAFG
jgi:hypothetical protein